MANKWVEHVRKWSADHGVTYMCATSMPACKEAYKKGKAPKNTQKANREQMGMEDKDVALPKAKISADTLKDKISQIKEAKKMGIEDIKSAMLRRAQGIVQPIQSADTAVVKPKGRPKKYETAEEARRMKSVKTVEARNRRRAEKAKAKEGSGLSGGMDPDKTSKYPAQDFNPDAVMRHVMLGTHIGYPARGTNPSMTPQEAYNMTKTGIFKELKKDPRYQLSPATQDALDKQLELNNAVKVLLSMKHDSSGKGYGGAHADEVDNYSMIINHLVEHISDPSEPVDPRDYDQAIHFIREMRRAKGGAELYSKEYYGGMMPAGAPPPPPPRSDAGRKVFHTPGLLELMEQFLRPAGAVPEDIRRAIIEGRNVPRLHGGVYTPVDSGNQFLDVIANTGHQLGQDHPASKFGLNPFDMGFKVGEKLGNAMMKTKLGNPHTGIFSKSFWTPKKKHH